MIEAVGGHTTTHLPTPQPKAAAPKPTAATPVGASKTGDSVKASGEANAAPSNFATSSSSFISALSSNWGSLGFDDGKLSQSQINTDMSNPKVKGNEAAEVAALDDMSDGKGVTTTQLQSYNSSYSQNKNSKYDNQYSWYQSRVDGQSSKLFATGSPNGNAVSQGSLGDCYFLSALSGEATKDPSAVKNMITSDSNGEDTVKLPGESSVTFAAPTEAQMARYGETGSNGTWGSVLEKAYAVSQAGSGAADPYQAIGNGGTTNGLEAVTGLNYKSVNLDGSGSQWWNPFSWGSSDKSQDKSYVESALATGDPATVATNQSVDGVPADHMLTLEGYNQKTNEVTLRNPWGWEPSNSNETDLGNGNFEMSFPQFQNTFRTLDYEG